MSAYEKAQPINTIFILSFHPDRPQQQCWLRSDAADCGVLSGSTPFVTHRAVLDKLTRNEINLFKV